MWLVSEEGVSSLIMVDTFELVEISLKRRSRDSSLVESPQSSEDETCEKDKFLQGKSLPEGSSKGEETKSPISLKKEITLVHGVSVIIGKIIGSGIFIAPTLVLTYAGSFGASLILWLFGAVVVLCAGLCYIEIGLLVGKSGGEFMYLTHAYSFRRRNKVVELLGSMMGFLAVWTDLCLMGPTGIAISVSICAQYFIRPFFIGCAVPELAVKLLSVSIISKCVYQCSSMRGGAKDLL